MLDVRCLLSQPPAGIPRSWWACNVATPLPSRSGGPSSPAPTRLSCVTLSTVVSAADCSWPFRAAATGGRQ